MNYVKNKDGTFTCPECGEIKQHQSTMYYHMKQKHLNESKYDCEECGKGFMQKSLLVKHIAAKHPELVEEEEVFECPGTKCNHVAKTKGNLRIHILRIHCMDQIKKIYKARESDNHPHKCIECGDKFKSMTAFYYHGADCIDITDVSRKFKKILA